LCASARDARAQMTVRGAPNGLNCVIVIAQRNTDGALQNVRKGSAFQSEKPDSACCHHIDRAVRAFLVSSCHRHDMSDMCLDRQLAVALCRRRRTNGVLLSSILKIQTTYSLASRFAFTLQCQMPEEQQS
jgi:hypothetical protein